MPVRVASSSRATSRAGVLRLTVTDDGVGGADASGSGIQGLGDRMAAIGGVLEVSNTQGGGTMVSAIVPLANASSEVAAGRQPSCLIHGRARIGAGLMALASAGRAIES